MTENINEELKQSVLNYLKNRLKKNGSDTISCNGKSYSSEKIIAEVEDGTKFGLEIIHDMVTLTIDRMSRNSIATWRLASDKPKLIVKGFDEDLGKPFLRSQVVLGLYNIEIHKLIYIELNDHTSYWLSLNNYNNYNNGTIDEVEQVHIKGYLSYTTPSLWTYDPVLEHTLNFKTVDFRKPINADSRYNS